MIIDRRALRTIIRDKFRLVFDDIDETYLSDALMRLRGNADVVAFPLSTREVSELMRYAFTHQIPVTPRGAGTNLTGSTVPLQGGIVLDLSRMNRIVELDTATFTATVEPGVLLEDFQAYVEAHGLFYPPDPGEKASTIGGNISTNAGGMRAVKYGVTRNYVRGLEVVLANGDIVALGSKNVKDASGLALKELMVGSEGTLGVITRCILRLIPKPEASESVLVPCADLQASARIVQAILEADTNPTALEIMQRKVVALGEAFLGVQYPHADAGAYLLLTFDGHAQEVVDSVDRAKEASLLGGALDFIPLTDPTISADVWRLRGALVKAVEALSEQEPIDIVVPINRSAAFLQFADGIARSMGIDIVSFGHAGDGNIHLCVMRGEREDAQWAQALHECMDRLYAHAYALGGLASGEHGIGISKRPYYQQQTDETNLHMMNAIKNALDPAHILNDQKSYIREAT